jgi:four helix bundle protein
MEPESSKSQPKKYDLGERTARFAEAIVRFANKVPRTPVTIPLISQLVAAGTSPGANYCEADEAVSKKDFEHMISTCKKESRETKYWLRVLVAAGPHQADEARPHWQEAHELHMIFASIHRNSLARPNSRCRRT